MIEISDGQSELRAVDAEKNEVTIGASGWDPTRTTQAIDRPVDETVSGRAASLRFPEAAICVSSNTRNQWDVLDVDSGPRAIEYDEYLLNVETDIKVYVRFENSAVITQANDRATHVEFPEPTSVTIGFRSPIRRPIATLTVPPTPTGVATAITYSGCAHDTTSPDRSYPTLRSHPPRITTADDTHIPTELKETAPQTGITIRVPPDLSALFITAPPAYYLQATVTVESRPHPVLTIPSEGVHHELSRLPTMQRDAADLLCRVFFLDCLIREAGPYGVGLEELCLLDDIGVDAEELYHLQPSARLARYLEAPYEQMATELPEWHLSMAIAPEARHIPTLPHILDRLALVYLPRATPVEKHELVTRSLDTATRTTAPTTPDHLIVPEWDRGRLHGWIAKGYPIGAFKCPPDTFDNRFEYVEQSEGPTRITVVVNDPTMDAEHSAASRIYRNRAEELAIDVEIKRNITREELARVFETPVEFVHFIGHCDEQGLRCSDGHLLIEDIDTAQAQTFFLNACGSYREGLELVRHGSIAGGVTVDEVLDDQATEVGIAFARLVVSGCSIALALRMASNQTIVSKNYAVVGDGTHSISQGYGQYPARVTDGPGDSFQVTGDMLSVRDHGSVFQSYLTESASTTLLGNAGTHSVTRERLLEHLQIANAPVIYNGDFYWSHTLRQELSHDLE